LGEKILGLGESSHVDLGVRQRIKLPVAHQSFTDLA
jgi:hypothetical protein